MIETIPLMRIDGESYREAKPSNPASICEECAFDVDQMKCNLVFVLGAAADVFGGDCVGRKVNYKEVAND